MGVGTFAVAYGASYVAALSSPSILSWLYVPVIGPWPVLDDVRQFTTDEAERPVKALLVADGVMQIAGLSLWLGSALLREQQLVRIPPEAAKASTTELVSYELAPWFDERGNPGLAVQGVF